MSKHRVVYPFILVGVSIFVGDEYRVPMLYKIIHPFRQSLQSGWLDTHESYAGQGYETVGEAATGESLTFSLPFTFSPSCHVFSPINNLNSVIKNSEVNMVYCSAISTAGRLHNQGTNLWWSVSFQGELGYWTTHQFSFLYIKRIKYYNYGCKVNYLYYSLRQRPSTMRTNWYKYTAGNSRKFFSFLPTF